MKFDIQYAVVQAPVPGDRVDIRPTVIYSEDIHSAIEVCAVLRFANKLQAVYMLGVFTTPNGAPYPALVCGYPGDVQY